MFRFSVWITKILYQFFFLLTSVFSSSAVVASITSSTGLSVVSVSAVSTSAASSSCPSSSSSSSSSSGSSPSFEGSFLSKYPQALMLFTASDRALSMKMSQGKTSKIYVTLHVVSRSSICIKPGFHWTRQTLCIDMEKNRYDFVNLTQEFCLVEYCLLYNEQEVQHLQFNDLKVPVQLSTKEGYTAVCTNNFWIFYVISDSTVHSSQVNMFIFKSTTIYKLIISLIS